MKSIAVTGKLDRVVVWVRTELRLRENLPLLAASEDAREVIPVYVVDEALPAPKLKVVLDGVAELRGSLRRIGGDLLIRRGDVGRVLQGLLIESNASGVYTSSALEPAQRNRQHRIARTVQSMGKVWREFKQQTIFDAAVTRPDGRPYEVYSAYRNAWLAREADIPPALPPLTQLRTPPFVPGALPTLESLGVRAPSAEIPPGGESEARRLLKAFAENGLSHYHVGRDLPARPAGTSRLSHHLASGSLAVHTVYHKLRDMAAGARGGRKLALATFRNELIWREFYYQVLVNHPHVVDGAFRNAYDDLRWDTRPDLLEAWKEGKTGVPIVDAAMRQLLQEAWMHNRGRMIVASFLTKDLHCDWRLGERHFWNHLADADLAANNGGWQWSAGTGTDAQPWFRIFNPVLQSKKFDPRGEYIRRYVPELGRVPVTFIHEPHLMPRSVQESSGCLIGRDYPAPVADHNRERLETLRRYGEIRQRSRRGPAVRSLNQEVLQ